MALDPIRLKLIARIARILLAVAILIYGLAISEPESPRLLALTLALFSLPLLLQIARSALVRAYALWLGIFLVVQSLLTPVLLGDAADLVINRPNMTITRNFRDGIGPGVPGPQTATTDSKGFRVFPSVDYQRPSEARIFAIGGSTTEQEILNDDATWTHRTQVALSERSGKKVEVINTGIRGIRAKNHVATFRYIVAFHPDMILFLTGANDWVFDAFELFGYDQPRRRWVFSNTILGRAMLAEYGRVFGRRSIAFSIVRPLNGEPSLQRSRKISWLPERASDQYLDNLRKISALCHERKITCVFLTQPSAYHPDAPDSLKKSFWMTPPAASYTLTFDSLIHIAEVYNRDLIEFAKMHGHPVCDLASKIGATTENFYDDVHFTYAGSQRVAEAVTACIEDVLDPSPATKTPLLDLGK